MRVLGADDPNGEGRNPQTAIDAGVRHSKLSSKTIGLWLSSAERGRYKAFLDRIRQLRGPLDCPCRSGAVGARS